MEFDHIAISGETLSHAIDHVQDALGVSLQSGGKHDVFHTHNALLGLEDGLYLEAIAINPDAPKPTRARWFALDDFKGAARLSNWICRTSDLASVLAQMPFDVGQPVSLQRDDLRWQMAVPHDGRLPFDNLAPALIQWQTTPHPATKLMASGCRLRRLTITHPIADQLNEALSHFLEDDRIAFETGGASLTADFDTPHGSRTLAS